MDIEQLTKHQLILLTLLVSFVTSIATGIVTVTLLDQGPQQITQTINRVVERTVEQVVPAGIQTVIKEVPLYVTEEEMITKAISASSPAVVRVTESTGTPRVFASGFILGSRGLIVSSIPASGTDLSTARTSNFRIMLADGTLFPATIVKKGIGENIVVLQVKADRQGDFMEALATRKPLEFAAKEPTVGQTVIGLGGVANTTSAVAVGIISSVTGTTTTSNLSHITTTAATADNIGGPLLDTKGAVLGIVTASGTAVGRTDLKVIIDSIK